jgi:hypothetical protein
MEMAMVEYNAPEGQQTPFKSGDRVINVNPTSLYYQRRGVFRRYWDDRYYFARGRGCDVEIDGVVVAMSVSDLELVEQVIV